MCFIVYVDNVPFFPSCPAISFLMTNTMSFDYVFDYMFKWFVFYCISSIHNTSDKQFDNLYKSYKD